MAKEDADKTAFHTGKVIFSYIMMPFGLINAGATYQRLIDTAFEKQIGRNLEAYVDDLVIKITTQERIIGDMRETFDTLCRINMKLNPLKCSFGETEGKILGYLVTEQGCLKQKSFVWTSEAETAFQEMKKLLKTLPTLIAPIDGETLYLYISVANEAFGSVLVAERDKIQKPVYFLSKAITGSEINYAPIEKFVYALILTSRSTVKGQVLADYLAEMTGELEVINERTDLKQVVGETWDLFTDGASCVEGAGAGLVLASPSGEEHTYTLRFNFDVINNEAEYEALLAGLNIARKMDITKLRAFTDSQLVANQFNGSFEAHDSSMQKYLQLLKELVVRFEHFELAQVPRSQNKKADASSKLAALMFLHFQKQVWVEELPSKSIDNDLMVASVVEEQPNWMEPNLQYICSDILPSDKREARLVREQAPMYIIQNDILYRNSYCGPMMRCVGPIEGKMIIDEVHNGSCAMHSCYKTIAAKIMRMGYFWPSLYRYVTKIVKRCKSCQRHAPQNRMPRHDMIPVNSPWPFHKWAIVIVGPFPAGPGNVKFLIMAIDYFTKWVEAKAVPTITGVQSTGETPFSLVYGSEAIIPAEILVPTHRVANFEEEANDDALGENLNFIKEQRLMTAIREANNKQQIAKYYNKRVRALSFYVGEWVLRNNDASRAEKLGKLGPNWEGPYQVVAINAAVLRCFVTFKWRSDEIAHFRRK
ncbi:uncharacterized protein [Rutidosis leptorrhynchoides]|uniref:uncharacterized protein n=1 Tax=Rutidosis leptorrhynchoides TaxID=125765 RepID=UPI003A99E396